MRWSFLKSALADVWYLVVILCVIAGVVLYKVTAGEPTSRNPATNVPAVGPARKADLPDAARPKQAPRLTEEQKAQTLIADYQKRLSEDPHGADAPALLLATGNLYMVKLKDPKEAARNYELLIQDFPNWPGIAGAFTQLMGCYEQLDDKDGLRWLYKEMMAKFPPESNEYQYAKAHLDS